ncbi:Peptidase S24-like protein (fragment) [Acidithiobacillus ferrivorans]|uniref:Peptidase S24-like protein n=1 Tax=Acidithiobacillus ferrivorans TaxID=160808 RepID=A0A060UVI8_9PROT
MAIELGNKKGPGRGGRREGAGRKAADGVTVADTVQITARVTPEQRERFLDLGGSEWLRAIIDRESDKNV